MNAKNLLTSASVPGRLFLPCASPSVIVDRSALKVQVDFEKKSLSFSYRKVKGGKYMLGYVVKKSYCKDLSAALQSLRKFSLASTPNSTQGSVSRNQAVELRYLKNKRKCTKRLPTIKSLKFFL